MSVSTILNGLCADANNLQKIKDAFPEYWQQYTEMAEHR